MIVNETFNLGGAETMALELANALVGIQGNEVFFVASDGVLLSRLDHKIKFYQIPRYVPSRIPQILMAFRRIFKAVKPDIVHAQGATVGVLASIAVRTVSSRIKVVITHHSAEFTRIPTFLADLMFKSFFDAFIAISKTRYEKFIQSGIASNKVVLIPNFINREKFFLKVNDIDLDDLRSKLGITLTDKVVVGAGRLIEEKGMRTFINTLGQVALQAPDMQIRGIILGDGPDRAHLGKMISELKVPNLRIMLLGFKDNIGAYLKLADVFLFPTMFKEVLPMILIEAITLGVPVVCSDIAGNNDIIQDSFNGFLVNTEKADYVTPLLRLLRDKALAMNFSFNGNEKAMELYDKNKVVGNIFQFYKTLG